MYDKIIEKQSWIVASNMISTCNPGERDERSNSDKQHLTIYCKTDMSEDQPEWPYRFNKLRSFSVEKHSHFDIYIAQEDISFYYDLYSEAVENDDN